MQNFGGVQKVEVLTSIWKTRRSYYRLRQLPDQSNDPQDVGGSTREPQQLWSLSWYGYDRAKDCLAMDSIQKGNMFGFLTKKLPKDSRPTRSDGYPSTSVNQQSPSGLHHEMIRGVFGELTRGHGIAPDVLAFDVFPLRRQSGDKEMHVQLIMLKWNESLLYQAPMLQHQMQLELGRYASTTGISAFVVTWKFSPACLTFALPRGDHRMPSQSEPVKVKDEITFSNEQKFVPHASAVAKMAPSLFEPYQKSAAFLPTEVNSIR